MYADKIRNDLTNDNWKAIFAVLHQLQETHTHKAQVEAGVVLEEHEPLLPADPPSLLLKRNGLPSGIGYRITGYAAISAEHSLRMTIGLTICL